MTVKKTCTKCDEMKPLDAFALLKRGKHGRAAACRVCRSKEAAARNERNPERNRAAVRQWRQADPERARAASRTWSKTWRANNPEAAAEQAARRRAAEYRAVFGPVDWEGIRRSGTHCHLCGDELPAERNGDTVHPDHLVPLSRGGAHSARNLLPAHASCNRSRQNRDIPALALLGAWTVQPVGCNGR